MSERILRSKVIRLAKAHPELQPVLLPLLKSAAAVDDEGAPLTNPLVGALIAVLAVQEYLDMDALSGMGLSAGPWEDALDNVQRANAKAVVALKASVLGPDRAKAVAKAHIIVKYLEKLTL